MVGNAEESCLLLVHHSAWKLSKQHPEEKVEEITVCTYVERVHYFGDEVMSFRGSMLIAGAVRCHLTQAVKLTNILFGTTGSSTLSHKCKVQAHLGRHDPPHIE